MSVQLKELSAAKVKRVSDAQLCLSRRKCGRGFQYFDCQGKKITNKKLIKRLRNLVIPPMWTDVQICKSPLGHIQAVGRDGKERKQYLYHEAWERQRQQEKFQKLNIFGAALPMLRKQAFANLKQKKWTKEKVLSLMVLILDQTGIRIGNQYYADQNQTYGLSTLRRKHLSVDDGEIHFEYKGKSNKHRQVSIDDPKIVRQIIQIAEQPGYEIFRYRESFSNWCNVNSDEVNAFIQEYIGDDFSSKDFRTWVASRLAVEHFPKARSLQAEHPRKKLDNVLVELVAKDLGNTKSVCRTYYIHPKILKAVTSDSMPSLTRYSEPTAPYQHSIAEKALLKLL